MLSRMLSNRQGDVPDVTDLEYLRQSTMLELAPLILGFGWLAGLRALRFDGPLESLPVAIALAAGALGALLLRRTAFRVARWWLIVAVIGAMALEAWYFPEGPARYYFPLSVVLSSLLVSHSGIFLVATLAAAAYVPVAWQHGMRWLDAERAISPLALIYLTAFVSWLASRQLQRALGWMQNSYTDARDALDQLREQRAALARTVKALEEAYTRIEKMNYALVEARNAAEEARRIKAEFAANISHELRTPLNLIIGFSETMVNAPETYGDVRWSPSLRGDVDEIYRSSCHLLSLIDDILDLSALDARRLGLAVEEVSLEDVIDGAISVMQALFRAKGLSLNVDLAPGLPRLWLDPTRIRQVLLNLLNNASRFTAEGGVTVTARLVDGGVQVAVADTGVGIASRDVHKVFEEFRQVDGSPSRAHEGTGLGIPLSRRLVELHGGRMWLESVPGQGTTFCFTLPTSMEERPGATGEVDRAPRRPAAALPAYRKSLLLADPGALLLHTLRRQLDGYDVIAVPDGDEISALVDRHQPVALVADSGEWDVFDTLRAWSVRVPPDLPTIAFPLRDSLGSARALGINDYLIKPVTRPQLLRAVEALGGRVCDVLIVDDDPRLAELLSRMLQSAGRGYVPVKALGGEDGLVRMRRQRPDLVLLDQVMPEVDGLAVLQAMRADPSLADVSVIVVTAHEYLQMDRARGGRMLGLARGDEFSAPELFTCLQSLLDALPLRAVSRPVSALAR